MGNLLVKGLGWIAVVVIEEGADGRYLLEAETAPSPWVEVRVEEKLHGWLRHESLRRTH